MPTKAKKQPSFFEKMRKQLSSSLVWVSKKIARIRVFYNRLNTNYIQIIRKKKFLYVFPPSLILLICFLVVAPFLITQVAQNDVIINGQDSGALTPTEVLYDGELTQPVKSITDGSKLRSIDIMFGTHARSNQAEYSFILKEDSEVVYVQDFSATILRDNAYHHFIIDPPIRITEGHKYSFTIRANHTSEKNAISVYYDETGELAYSVRIVSPFYGLVAVVAIVFLLIFCTINILINSKKITDEFHFLAYFLPYVISLVFIFPVYTIPDESYHFISALRLTEYDLSESPAYNLRRSEHRLPANSQCLMTYFHNVTALDGISNNDIFSCFTSAPDAISDKYSDVGSKNTARIIAYAPAALGILFGNLISDSPMIIFYFGRVFNLLVVSIIIIAALNLIKKHRLIFLATFCLPMFLQQAISYSYDGLLNALCILIIAYGIRFITTEAKVRKRDIIIMAVALAMIGIIKIPYVLVAAPLLFVKTEKFGKYKIAKFLILVGLLISMVVPHVVSDHFESIGQENLPDIDMSLYDPFHYERGRSLKSFSDLKTFIRMLLMSIRGLSGFYVASLIGYFGWFYFALDPAIVGLYLAFLIIVVLSESKIKLSNFARLGFILVAGTISMAIFLAMYLDWTLPVATVIEGVQGRYFLPVLPLIMFAFIPQKKKISLSTEACFSFINLATLIFIITILVGFY